MKGSKWLGEIIKERGIVLCENGKNEIIISPCGSGKTHFIINELCKGKKCLYLCDTNNLQYQVNKELNNLNMSNMEVMTYAKFGSLIRYTNNSFIEQYEIVIADEVHNLIDFQNFSGSKEQLILATEYLIKRYNNTDILFFTATPKYLDILARRYPSIDENFNQCKDFTEDTEIKRYTERSISYIGHYSSIERYLVSYQKYFKFMEGKCLIYTTFIDIMENIKGICDKFDFLRPICIWSLNPEDKSKLMTDEQLRVRQHLLDTGELLEPYNVLIINRSTETGVNIYDKHMELMICDTTNDVQQIQARNRIRQDIDLLVLKTERTEILAFDIGKDLLDKWLTKETVMEFIIVKNNLRNKDGILLTVNKLVKDEDILKQYGYQMISDKKQIKGKRCVMYQITKLNNNKSVIFLKIKNGYL